MRNIVLKNCGSFHKAIVVKRSAVICIQRGSVMNMIVLPDAIHVTRRPCGGNVVIPVAQLPDIANFVVFDEFVVGAKHEDSIA